MATKIVTETTEYQDWDEEKQVWVPLSRTIRTTEESTETRLLPPPSYQWPTVSWGGSVTPSEGVQRHLLGGNRPLAQDEGGYE